MTVAEPKEFKVSHCLICDEVPPASGYWGRHLQEYIDSGRVLVEWKSCTRCYTLALPSGTLSVVQFDKEW